MLNCLSENAGSIAGLVRHLFQHFESVTKGLKAEDQYNMQATEETVAATMTGSHSMLVAIAIFAHHVGEWFVLDVCVGYM